MSDSSTASDTPTPTLNDDGCKLVGMSVGEGVSKVVGGVEAPVGEGVSKVVGGVEAPVREGVSKVVGGVEVPVGEGEVTGGTGSAEEGNVRDKPVVDVVVPAYVYGISQSRDIIVVCSTLALSIC